jgi:hypothetical protein
LGKNYKTSNSCNNLGDNEMNFDYKRMLKFEHNVGEKEKKYRLIAGSIALLVSLPLASILLLIVGVALVATGYSGWCPAYSGLDKNTLEK